MGIFDITEFPIETVILVKVILKKKTAGSLSSSVSHAMILSAHYPWVNSNESCRFGFVL